MPPLLGIISSIVLFYFLIPKFLGSPAYHTLLKNKPLEFVYPLLGKKLICCNWFSKSKYNVVGNIKKYKVRLMGKGYAQIKGFNYEEEFYHMTK